MRIFISGGAKNGKSMRAQKLARDMAEAGGLPLYYVATMDPHDGEDEARIARHRRERAGWGFETLEQARNLPAVLERADPAGVFLLDSLTALTANEMFPPSGFDPAAGERTAGDLAAFLRQVRHCVLVSDYIYGDAALYDEYTTAYLRALALCDRAAAKLCECVLEVSADTVICHKGERPCV